MRYYDPPASGHVIQVHIADIHFGAIDPKKQFMILQEQFLDRISTIHFDILSIDGDIFDKKFMANSDAVMYAIEFVKRCTMLCQMRSATLVIIGGTHSHDAEQLKLFYNLRDDPMLDVRIVETARFEFIKGLRVLCLPEEYGKGEDYYRNLLNEVSDTVFMHGTVVGSVYGANKEDLGSKKYPVFSIDSFNSCRGPIIAGHVHKAMCLNSYIYYCSNPIRYRFGEEEEKGFCIVIHNLVNSAHTFDFIPIKSFRYDTINIESLNWRNPESVTAYLDMLLLNGVDNIRIDFSSVDAPTTQKIIEEYYVNNPNVHIKRFIAKQEEAQVSTTSEIENKYSDLGFLLDPNLDSYEKFVQFINHNMGSQFITVEKLKSVLAGGI